MTEEITRTKFLQPEKKPIDGVIIHPLRVIPDERGRLMEIMRRDDPFFNGFGQVYMTTVYPGVVKAWHYHAVQVDRFTCIKGMIKAVLYDDRENSPTRGALNEIFMGEHNPCLVVIPAGVYHGWKCVGESEAYVVNVPSEPYNRTDPDEYRLDPHVGGIPYDWSRVDG
ncbi:dTDP-4-dehydrorhamnose 3,5-epimerase family protein [Desulfomonile tiedjei]|uniref:dTDP-4-dehydrorhamnose 3,5-epimerase n=1 Tax=Desulfomonile tiedjei (strain ATCC 49306 / DSM 6799 / DCB-1) TaxID=706587 RepID=I4C0W6_DESTA|nr:dTDP-4-dehydrorhamnose 3,5-epimerase family protein [Desulfomonile tiedjei]AFM23207.1 dTDP-4-dehydrorhamnose 3,5-epimerase-like enzyme [Desulfomonile tiedjei DSM 6799]